MIRWPHRGLVAAALVATAAACGGGNRGGEGGPGSEVELTVFAAASLTDAFAKAGARFEEQNPGTDVSLNLGASSALALQIGQGAPADVFASADIGPMEVVVEDGATAGPPRPFATNRLQIAVPPANPGGVAGVADFARDELLIGLCAAEVPCGALGRRVLDAAGVVPAVDTDERDVRALLTKIEAGELDAGLVYETDVEALAGAVEGIDIPEAENVVATYHIAALADSAAPDEAAGFVAFVLSTEGIETLGRFGFGPP